MLVVYIIIACFINSIISKIEFYIKVMKSIFVEKCEITLNILK